MGNGVATKPIYRNIGGTIFILYSPSIDQCAGKKRLLWRKKVTHLNILFSSISHGHHMGHLSDVDFQQGSAFEHICLLPPSLPYTYQLEKNNDNT